jgi:hypothetical protein
MFKKLFIARNQTGLISLKEVRLHNWHDVTLIDKVDGGVDKANNVNTLQ